MSLNNQNNLRVEVAGKDDALIIAEMSQRTFYDTFAKDNTKEDMDIFLNKQFSKDALVAEVENGDGIFLLAYDEDVPCGYVRMRYAKPDRHLTENAIEIARIYTEKNVIGKGVGAALMQKCIEIATNQQKEMIWLGVWEKNERAIAFYQKWGFEKFSEHPFLLGNDLQTDWLMKRML